MSSPQCARRRLTLAGRTVAACLLSLGLLAASGCGSGSISTATTPPVDSSTPQLEVSTSATEQSSDPAEEPTEEATTPSPTETATADTQMTTVDHVWHFSNQAGYKYDLQISVGTPVPYESGMTLLGNDVGSYCATVTEGADAVVPVVRTVTAMTAGYETKIATDAVIAGSGLDYAGTGITPAADDERLDVEEFFSGGEGDCTAMSSSNYRGFGGADSLGVNWREGMAEGASGRNTFYVIIKNFYTPATPEGDTALLDWMAVRPVAAVGDDDADPANVFTEGEDARDGDYSLTGVTLSGKLVTYDD